MRKLDHGQTIIIEGLKYEVIGILVFGTYNEYHLLRPDGTDVWMDDCMDGRLWEKTENRHGRKSVLDLLDWSTKDLRDLLGNKLGSAVVTAVSVELVREATGQVDDVEKGEKVFCVEGVFSSSSKRSPLFAAEIWDGENGPEVEFSEGRLVKVAIT